MAGLGLMNRRRAIASSPTAGNALKKVLASCVGWYTFEGKSNTAEDRDVVRDQSGNGNDLMLHNMRWGWEHNSEAAIKEGYFGNALYFRPNSEAGTSYGSILLIEPLTEFTIICKRGAYAANNQLQQAWRALIGSGQNADATLLYCEVKNDSGQWHSGTQGMTYYGRTTEKIVWMTPTHYCGKKLTGTAIKKNHDGYLYLNKFRGNIEGGGAQQYFGIYIFNRQLTPEEIEEFIHTYIDASYVMPTIE